MKTTLNKTDIETLMDALIPYTFKGQTKPEQLMKVYLTLRNVWQCQNKEMGWESTNFTFTLINWLKYFFVNEMTKELDQSWHELTVVDLAEMLLNERN